MIPSGNGNLFHVSSSAHVLDLFKRIQADEIKAGRGEEFVQALFALHDRLRDDPKGFGESLFRLPALKLVVYVGILVPFVVHYGVHEDKPLVFIKSVQRFTSS